MNPTTSTLCVRLGDSREALDLLRTARVGLQVSDDELAGVLGTTRAAISGAFIGHDEISLDHLLRLCNYLDVDSWEVARMLGVAGDYTAALLHEALALTTNVAIEDYVAARTATTQSPLDLVREALSPSYKLRAAPVERGRTHRRRYHTYLRVRDAREPAQPLGDAHLAKHHLKRIRGLLAASDCTTAVHIELSELLLSQVGMVGELVLIVEDAFENKGIEPDRAATSPVRNLAPLVVLGTYYSGAKDVAVLLHDRTGFGAVDLSSYVAECCINPEALRKDVQLPARAFDSALKTSIADRLIVTVDDADSILAHQSRRRWRWRQQVTTTPGTAIVLQMSDRLLAYAGYHVARTESRMSGARRPTAEAAASRSHSLRDIQERLIRHGSGFMRRLLIPVDLPADLAAENGFRFADEVDRLFDIYVETADDIIRRLENPSPAFDS